MHRSQDYILNGSAEAKKISKYLKSKFTGQKITLAVILVGSDPASKIYINIKEKKAQEFSVNFKKFLLPATISENKLLLLINKLNLDKNITGIILQLPLPVKFNQTKIISTISPAKDVDGFVNSKILNPTIQSILHLIKISKQNLSHKKAIILANGKDFSHELQTEFIKQKIKTDIIIKPKSNIDLTKYNLIVSALGKKNFIKPNIIKKNTIIIDVGISRPKNSKKIFGDVHPDCFQKSPYISPVPGGVGPLTVVFLFKNLIKLKK